MQSGTRALDNCKGHACTGRFVYRGGVDVSGDCNLDGVLRLNAIRLPFPMEIVARRGGHLLSGSRRWGVLAQGESIAIGCYRAVSYKGPAVIDPRVGYELHLRICREITEPALDTSERGQLAVRLARAVFLHPAHDWSVDAAATYMQVPTGRMKARLLQENSAYSTIVREQRATRALLTLLAHGRAREQLAQTARLSGFSDTARLNAAFIAHFGVSASRVATLAWYPAITWSFVATLALADVCEA
jgi:AraC-like DNA-binding protein